MICPMYCVFSIETVSNFCPVSLSRWFSGSARRARTSLPSPIKLLISFSSMLREAKICQAFIHRIGNILKSI